MGQWHGLLLRSGSFRPDSSAVDTAWRERKYDLVINEDCKECNHYIEFEPRATNGILVWWGIRYRNSFIHKDLFSFKRCPLQNVNNVNTQSNNFTLAGNSKLRPSMMSTLTTSKLSLKTPMETVFTNRFKILLSKYLRGEKHYYILVWRYF